MLEIEEDRLGREALLYRGRPMLHHRLATTCSPWGRSPPVTMLEARHCWPICIHLCGLPTAYFSTLPSSCAMRYCSTVTQSTHAPSQAPIASCLFAGGMQPLGGMQSNRVPPKAAASAASAAPANSATASADATLSASKAAQSAPAGSSHAPAAPSAVESIAASSRVPVPSQLAASSDSGASAAEQTPVSGQRDGAQAESGQATSAQTGQSSQSMPPAAQGTDSHQPTQNSQQSGPPPINERGPVPAHKQNGQLQVWACYCCLPRSACRCMHVRMLLLARTVSRTASPCVIK